LVAHRVAAVVADAQAVTGERELAGLRLQRPLRHDEGHWSDSSSRKLSRFYHVPVSSRQAVGSLELSGGGPMKIDRFHMERTQSLYENEVRWNLSESGVAPLRVEELLEGENGREELLATVLKYPESNGSLLLRERIAQFYPGAAAENILVTT